MWRSQLDDAKEHEGTIESWCQAHGISQNEYYYRKRKYREMDAGRTWPRRRQKEEPGSSDWLSLTVHNETELPLDSGSIVVRVGNATIEVRSGFDAVLLRSIVKALGDGPC